MTDEIVTRLLVAELVAFEGVIINFEPSVATCSPSDDSLIVASAKGRRSNKNTAHDNEFVYIRINRRNASSPSETLQYALDALLQVQRAKVESCYVSFRPEPLDNVHDEIHAVVFH